MNDGFGEVSAAITSHVLARCILTRNIQRRGKGDAGQPPLLQAPLYLLHLPGLAKTQNHHGMRRLIVLSLIPEKTLYPLNKESRVVSLQTTGT